MKYNKTYVGLFVLIIIALISAAYFMQKDTTTSIGKSDPVTQYKNGTYVINGESITLTDGSSEKEINISSALKVKSFTNYFGKELLVDVNNDGVRDGVVIISQNNNTGKIEYYLVVVVTTGDGYATTNSVFIESDITPKAPTFENNTLSVEYTKDGEETSKSFAVNNNVLIELQKENLLED